MSVVKLTQYREVIGGKGVASVSARRYLATEGHGPEARDVRVST